jgi:hypothetical protein
LVRRSFRANRANQPINHFLSDLKVADLEVMPLITCLECGVGVSDTARVCVTCGGDPRGVHCRLCSEPIAKSKALGRLFWDGEDRHTVGYHPECLGQFERDHFKNVNVRCPDCAKSLDVLLERRFFVVEDLGWDWKTDRHVSDSDPDCPFCGRRKVLSRLHHLCAKCCLPIYALVHEYYGRHVFGIVSWTDDVAPVYGYKSPYNYFHYPRCSLGISPPSPGERDYLFTPGNPTPVVVWDNPPPPAKPGTNRTGCALALITLMGTAMLLVALMR